MKNARVEKDGGSNEHLWIARGASAASASSFNVPDNDSANREPSTPTYVNYHGGRWSSMHGAAALCICMAITGSKKPELLDFQVPEARSLPGLLTAEIPDWLSAWLVVIACLILVSWAVWESVQFPRHVSTHSTLDKLRTLMQLLGDLILIPVYALLPGEVPKLGYSRTHQNLRILERCPTLKSFKQTAWLKNPYLAMGVLMYRDLTEAGSRAILEIDRELLKTPDGGVIALDWWTSIPEGMVPDKVLVIGSTFTGDALPATQQDICKHFSARGWRCVIIVKRGCGLTMPNLQPESTTSKPWCFSNFDDTNLAINHVADKFPDLPVCGLGLSCGAAQLRNYVYMTGEHSRLNACVVIDAAESWVEAVPSIDHRQPLISKILSIAAARSFQNCNMPNADQWTDSVLDFTRKCMAPAHGFDMDCMSYFWSCQPADPAGCRVPVLELASYNDVLIDVPGVKDLSNLHMASPHVVNCTTRSGTHIIRWQGLRPQDWLSVVACEFLEASLSTVAEESATTIQ